MMDALLFTTAQSSDAETSNLERILVGDGFVEEGLSLRHDGAAGR